ncbi:T-cell surface protein tactile [Xyrichtys novacula]|uniref:T-cell surface protein tactile n=1 Tax=Xyrichtys novacula TaxID=13765 RepID=A0AAV1FSM9_XYRNO|nr:T-cell surface protein tactile [Xyrichtys novacula]
MSLGSSEMAGSALGMASSLLLLASIIQGIQGVEVFHYKKIEALVGQNVSLPCYVKNPKLLITSIEWVKMLNESVKLAVYAPGAGVHPFWSNVTILTEGESMGSLQLRGVSKWDSGVYVCALTTYPLGSFKRETELKIKDVETMCNVNSTVTVHAGGNVSIHCSLFPDGQYSWTKNKELVSVNESLELWQVTKAHTGVYTLTVNTGNTSVHKDFFITVLTETTSTSRDLITLPPQSNGTETSLSQTTDGNLSMSMTTVPPTINTTFTWTTSDSTLNYSHTSHVTTTSTYQEHSTSTPDPNHFNSTTHQQLNQTHGLNTSTFHNQSAASNLSTTLSYGSTMFTPTQETRNESGESVTKKEGYPGPTPTQSNRDKTVNEVAGTDGSRSRLVLVIVIILLLSLIVVAGVLYRRSIMKQRMDLPPPFKPPPPPVKYTSARQRETFPISRCNSTTEPEDVKQSFIRMPDILHNDNS